jgi:two-component sensor histidine kinase
MQQSKPCILLIDDDDGICRLVTKHFTRAGYDLTCERHSKAGMAKIRTGGIDAVILDHILPESDGLNVLKDIKALADSPPVVYLTGSLESRVAVSALKAGAEDYVVKDLQGEFLELLETAVRNALKSAAFRRAKEEAEAEVRKARDDFKALAEERALLMREVNHRVSNSLQLIASLLHFQADLSKNTDVEAALKEANGRVLAVARVHRWLYTSDDVRSVSLADYLQTLIRDLDDVSANAQKSVTIDAEHIEVEPDRAVAVGIIATELILNAFKHAYPDGRGSIRVALTGIDDGVAYLIVEDDGVGVLNGSGISQQGLGKRIIRGMAEKLDGSLTYDAVPKGTRAVLSFQVKPPRIMNDKASAVTVPISAQQAASA